MLLWLRVVCAVLLAISRQGDSIYPSEEDDQFDAELHFKDSEQVPAMDSWQIRRLHKHMDLNGDGTLGIDELKHFARKMRKETVFQELHTVYAHYDRDNDGHVSEAEAIAFESVTHEHEPAEVNKRRVEFEKAKFHAADDNRDGFLNEEETVGWLYPETHDRVIKVVCDAKMMAKDKNNDEGLTPQEFWFGDVLDSQRAHIPPLGDAEESDFRELDTDGDGLLNVAELEEYESGNLHMDRAIRILFKLGDKDLDGALSLDEMDTARVDIIRTEAHWYMHQWEMALPRGHEDEL